MENRICKSIAQRIKHLFGVHFAWTAPLDKSSSRGENWPPKQALYLDAECKHCVNVWL